MIKRFCTVMSIEIMIILLLCGCSAAETKETQTNKAANSMETQIAGEVTELANTTIESTELIAEQAKEKIKDEEKEHQTREEKQAEETLAEEETKEEYYWSGEVLNAYNGVVEGPSGRETYYNLPMGGVIDIMRSLGYDEESYPYWVRDDGVKMLGSYVMCAASLDIRPYGTILESSLGTAIVCDTGTFVYSDPYQLDIAVAW